MKWFKHETNASQDSKLRKLKMRYGLEGFGLYWHCLELIGSTVEPHNLTFELEHDAEIIADFFNVHVDKIQEMMSFMVELGLFEQDGMIITCFKMAVRADEYTQKALRNIQKSGQYPDNIRTISGHTPDKVPSKRKKERKIDIASRFTPPTTEEVSEYCNSRNNGVNAQKFIDHYAANGWMRGKTKIKDWKACVRTWEKNSQENNGYQENYL